METNYTQGSRNLKNTKSAKDVFEEDEGHFFGDETNEYMEDIVDSAKTGLNFITSNWKTIVPAIVAIGAAAYFMSTKKNTRRRMSSNGRRTNRSGAASSRHAH